MFKSFLNMLGNEASPAVGSATAVLNGTPHREEGRSAAVTRRHSPGLEQFLSALRESEDLSILDMAGASQANVSFLAGLGHRPYPDDIVHAIDSAFGLEDSFAAQSDPDKVARFMAESLDFEGGQFGGALAWDTLQYLAPPLLQQTVDQLHYVMQPGSYLLAFFNADEKTRMVPGRSYRIADSKTLTLTPNGKQRPGQFFNNRSIEKLFCNFRSLKFFLTRDHLREVIVRR